MRVYRPAILSLLAVAVFGFSALHPTGAQQQPRVLENDQNNFYERSVELALAPEDPLVSEIRAGLEALDPRVGIEIALSIPVAPVAFTPAGWREVYAILQSISTMEGITYWSASREEWRTFYEQSYVIDDPERRNRLPDPAVGRVPRQERLWAFQEDGSFGENVQRLDYRSDSDSILLSIENRTAMVYKMVPLVRPGNLTTYLLVSAHPDRGELRFYGNLGVRVPSLFGMQDRARDSFYNRIVALHDWFVAELDAAGILAE